MVNLLKLKQIFCESKIVKFLFLINLKVILMYNAVYNQSLDLIKCMMRIRIIKLKCINELNIL